MSSSPLLSQDLTKIALLYRADEGACLEGLVASASLLPSGQLAVVARATRWIEEIRRTHKASVTVTDMLSRFGLSSDEGLALMCLAEALLRIPDRATADAFIRDKLSEAHWTEALGAGAPWAMNVTGWALSLTGAIVKLDDPAGAAVGKLIARLGQPVIREALKAAMTWMADQFVTGETIDSALKRATPHMTENVRYSFDMLGEGARTAEAAEAYFQAYERAIDSVGAFQAAHKFSRPSGISIKLSALHPRYEMAQRGRVMRELVPRLVSLCERAARYDIPVTIDAEEADRLQLSLEVADEVLAQARLGSWEGLGFAVQAYQKRAPAVIDCFVEMARRHKRRLSLRLVKGAYWDSEIKRAQERGWDDFPVFTRKAATDVSYYACARRMLDALDVIDPVFGTHNALTVAHIVEMSGDTSRIEFQKLHGMNDALYRLMQDEGFKTCVYAPVGEHDVLLGYLVRRILENGANSSFVHRLLDRSVSVTDLTRDPVAEIASTKSKLRRAPDLFGAERRNSAGLDLADPFVVEGLLVGIQLKRCGSLPLEGRAGEGGVKLGIVDSKLEPSHQADAPPPCPSPQGGGNASGIHSAGITNLSDVDSLFQRTQKAYPAWSNTPVDTRAQCLERLGDLLEQNRAALMALLIHEAGKTVPDALSEVREAVDFCRYYALRAREDFAVLTLPGPTGESNQMRLVGRGVFVCISPWNFPLAIFLGQVTAALVAGNCVVAKAAPQTPLIAVTAVRLIHEAGVPAEVMQIVTGGASVGAALVEHPLVAGVAFTGSCATARSINRTLANKDGAIVPLIAETGGQNALIVDSSALPEQVVDDVITSAFRSAGQRCSALRVLCLPEAAADRILAMLKGAMRELRVGDPSKLETDVGPVIDAEAQKRLLDHVERLKREAKEIYTVAFEPWGDAVFVAPQVWEIPSVAWLTGEVFGPILHVVRYRPEKLGDLITQINATGFGLTGGVHSRIESTVRQLERDLHVGNFYVNRSLIGAVVGVQPFGGEGLSGTGPKAGGCHYLPRFALERVTSNNTTAAGGNASLLASLS